jgi:acetoin utilization protein AcuC
MNDINTPRFDVDQLEDGTKTNFGYNKRNLEAEELALKAGLAPGQIYRGPRLLKESVRQFESFVNCMGQDLYFVEPLFYHVAIIFESYNFHYQVGKRFMEKIASGFSEGGDLIPLLDGSTPFRQPEAANHIRLRSWAVHDNILGQPFSNVTMYKYVDEDTLPCSEFALPW